MNNKNDNEEFAADGVSKRIVDTARGLFFSQGYQGMTMDELAEKLGMSKKTLYVYFPGKEPLLRVCVEMLAKRVTARLEAILAKDDMDFPSRLNAVINEVFGALSKLSPRFLKDIQKYAPEVFQILEEVRSKNVPRVFGQLIREGIAQGYIRPSVDPDFAAYAWLQFVRALTTVDSLEHLGMPPQVVVKKAFQVFWPGLLTQRGYQSLQESHSAITST